MTRDEAFIADAGKRRVELSPSDGDQIMAVLGRSAAMPKKVIEQFNATLEAQN